MNKEIEGFLTKDYVELTNAGLIPIKIKARINFPKEILDMLDWTIDQNHNINDKYAFLKPLGYSGPEYHAGLVSLLNKKTVELDYYYEGNWFAVYPNEMKKFKGFEKYYYKFEPAMIKGTLLDNIEILEFGLPNQQGNGRKHDQNKYPYLLTVFTDKQRFNLNIEKADLQSIKQNFEYLLQNLSDTYIRDISFDQKEIVEIESAILKLFKTPIKIQEQSKVVTGRMVLNKNNQLTYELNNNIEEIKFSIEYKNVL